MTANKDFFKDGLTSFNIMLIHVSMSSLFQVYSSSKEFLHLAFVKVNNYYKQAVIGVYGQWS